MSIAKISEIKSSSTKSFDDAIQAGIARAHQTLENVKSAWVQDFEVITDGQGKIAEYRVLMKITFVLNDKLNPS